MSGLVIHVLQRTPGDGSIFIGRRRAKLHWGNPFSHLEQSAAAVKVDTLEQAISYCEQWLLGTAFQEIEPERREWILENLSRLEGHKLACFCADPKDPEGIGLSDPDCCHGQVYLRLLAAKAQQDKEVARRERVKKAIAPWTARNKPPVPPEPKVVQPTLF